MNRLFAAVSLLAFALCLPVSAQQTNESKDAPVKTAPVSYGLVVDNSGSFRLLLDRVIAAAADVIDTNGADDEAFLLTFVDSDKIVLRQEFTDSKSELHDAAENMFIEGGLTAILDAVKTSAEYLARSSRNDQSRAKALILITDGEDRASRAKIDEVLKILKEDNIRVFVIAISTEKVFTKIPERLTRETGGTMLMPKTRADLSSAAKEISAAMRRK